MGFSIEATVPVFTVFLQGLLSFFSPCVLPLLPMYISYLSGGGRTVDGDGAVHYRRGRVLLNTCFFVLGISFAFFFLGLGFSAAGSFFRQNRLLLGRVGGVIVILFGLYQLGVFGSSRLLNREARLPFRLDKVAMNPLVALVLGFTFSFAWTPCVGPTLASVLLLATSAQAAQGFLLIGVYTLGFVLPFLAVGLFTGTLLELFRKHRNVVKYTVKIGGVLMVFMGVMMLTGLMNSLTSTLSGLGSAGDDNAATSSVAETSSAEESSAADPDAVAAPDFTLKDQFGQSHTLSDYRGKVVFLNFWGTWCPPCRNEMPEIQELYEEYGENQGDVVFLGVSHPGMGSEGSQEDVAAFMEENGYTYPTLMDEGGQVTLSSYYASGFPTTFMIDAQGNVYGYITGQLTKEIMEDIIQQTMEGKREE